jgi:NTP pyrophosphatase (non-canonical NTP hydrolase)
MTLQELTDAVAKVSDIYSQKFGIDRDADWYILKLQEELGELVQSYLMLTGRARKKDQSEQALVDNFAKEAADVLCHVLLLAKVNNVDLEKVVDEKWLVWNKK